MMAQVRRERLWRASDDFCSLDKTHRKLFVWAWKCWSVHTAGANHSDEILNVMAEWPTCHNVSIILNRDIQHVSENSMQYYFQKAFSRITW